jgi:hypothetical protein
MGPEDQHPWDREDEEIRQAFVTKDTEIERLKGENDLLLMKVGCLESLRSRDKELITELADDLQAWTGWLDKGDTKPQSQLIQRAREATR